MSTAYHVGTDGECLRVRSSQGGLMPHTPEPWKVVTGGPAIDISTEEAKRGDPYAKVIARCRSFNPNVTQREARANADRIVSCVNGAAGLNPAAYRACVEALEVALVELRLLREKITPGYPEMKDGLVQQVKQALVQAEQGGKGT